MICRRHFVNGMMKIPGWIPFSLRTWAARELAIFLWNTYWAQCYSVCDSPFSWFSLFCLFYLTSLVTWYCQFASVSFRLWGIFSNDCIGRASYLPYVGCCFSLWACGRSMCPTRRHRSCAFGDFGQNALFLVLRWIVFLSLSTTFSRVTWLSATVWATCRF